MANISQLPPELFQEITLYLPFSDVKSVSLCSRQCRSQSLQTIFRGIEINHQSAAALQEGGSLSSIKSNIRFAKLNPSNILLEPMQERINWIVKACRDYLDILKASRCLESMEIANLNVAAYIRDRLLCAIFKVLSSYPCHRTLKNISVISPVEPEYLNDPEEYGVYIENLISEDRVFLVDSFPPEEYVGFLRESFSIEKLSLNMREPEKVDEGQYRGFSQTLLQAFGGSLKRLTLYPPNLSEPTDPIFNLPNLTYLHIIYDFEGQFHKFTRELIHQASNTEELRISMREHDFYETFYDYDFDPGELHFDTGTIPFQEIGKLSKLKRVFLPRPLGMNGKLISREQLSWSLDSWLGPRTTRDSYRASQPPSPLFMLEYAEFGRDPDDFEGSLACNIYWGEDGEQRYHWIAPEQPFWIRMQEDPELPLVGVSVCYDGYESSRDAWFREYRNRLDSFDDDGDYSDSDDPDNYADYPWEKESATYP